ncbi:MAG: hypothetical protein ACNA7E_08870 [Wenzhouxiangellaceae bacterium]
MASGSRPSLPKAWSAFCLQRCLILVQQANTPFGITSPERPPRMNKKGNEVPEINLHLKLNRASGVLAGIVAALAQQGLELKSQKINRDDDGKKATLDIVCEGELPDPAELAERLNAARGVEGVQRIESDGQLLMVDGAPVQSPAAVNAEPAEQEHEISGAATVPEIADEPVAEPTPAAAVAPEAEPLQQPQHEPKPEPEPLPVAEPAVVSEQDEEFEAALLATGEERIDPSEAANDAPEETAQRTRTGGYLRRRRRRY